MSETVGPEWAMSPTGLQALQSHVLQFYKSVNGWKGVMRLSERIGYKDRIQAMVKRTTRKDSWSDTLSASTIVYLSFVVSLGGKPFTL